MILISPGRICPAWSLMHQESLSRLPRRISRARRTCAGSFRPPEQPQNPQRAHQRNQRRPPISATHAKAGGGAISSRANTSRWRSASEPPDNNNCSDFAGFGYSHCNCRVRSASYPRCRTPGEVGEEDDYAIIALETEAEFDRSSDLQPHQLPESQPLIRPEITPTRQQRVSSAPRTKEWLEAQEAAGLKTHLLPTGNEAEMPVEPAIRVTIGRVDVRLVQPPATAKPPPTRTTTPPALSLDEYLKKRSDGRQ